MMGTASASVARGKRAGRETASCRGAITGNLEIDRTTVTGRDRPTQAGRHWKRTLATRAKGALPRSAKLVRSKATSHFKSLRHKDLRLSAKCELRGMGEEKS
jgi:hypothetical protein